MKNKKVILPILLISLMITSCASLMVSTVDRDKATSSIGEIGEPKHKSSGGTMKESYHPFRSKNAKETYLTYYDEYAKRWPIASECKLVKTSFGQTFVRVSGPKDGPPLVLLPGDSENSLSWIPQIAALSVEYRTYALDHIFDNGRSIYTRPMKKPSDFVQWLDELFTALELDSINLVGFSYGGWQASLYALSYPQHLNRAS